MTQAEVRNSQEMKQSQTSLEGHDGPAATNEHCEENRVVRGTQQIMPPFQWNENGTYPRIGSHSPYLFRDERSENKPLVNSASQIKWHDEAMERHQWQTPLQEDLSIRQLTPGNYLDVAHSSYAICPSEPCISAPATESCASPKSPLKTGEMAAQASLSGLFGRHSNHWTCIHCGQSFLVQNVDAPSSSYMCQSQWLRSQLMRSTTIIKYLQHL